MRHGDIALNMNTYTDARLLDTAAAVEALPSLPLNWSDAPMVAPNLGDCGKPGSIPNHKNDSAPGSSNKKNAVNHRDKRRSSQSSVQRPS